MQYTAIIPVKQNSSRLPGKNLLPLGNESLLERKIRQLQISGIADRIIVSSDSDEMLRLGLKMGVDAIKRPKHFADESKSLSEFFKYIADLFDEQHMIWACVTSPFFDENLMQEAKSIYEKNIGIRIDSLLTVYKFKHYLFDKNGPLNFEAGERHQNSQQLESIDLFTNGMLIAPKESVRQWGYNYGPNHYRFYVNQIQSLDIDTEEDYVVAKAYQSLLEK